MDAEDKRLVHEFVGYWLGGSIWCNGCMKKNSIDPETINSEDLITLEEALGMVGGHDPHCCDNCGESLLIYPEGVDLSKVFRRNHE